MNRPPTTTGASRHDPGPFDHARRASWLSRTVGDDAFFHRSGFPARWPGAVVRGGRFRRCVVAVAREQATAFRNAWRHPRVLAVLRPPRPAGRRATAWRGAYLAVGIAGILGRRRRHGEPAAGTACIGGRVAVTADGIAHRPRAGTVPHHAQRGQGPAPIHPGLAYLFPGGRCLAGVGQRTGGLRLPGQERWYAAPHAGGRMEPAGST